MKALSLRTRQPGKKWVSGLRPEIGKNSSRDWSRNWPCLGNGGKIRIFRVLSHFFPIFSAGPISGPISGAIFFLFRAGGPKPIFNAVYDYGLFSPLEGPEATGAEIPEKWGKITKFPSPVRPPKMGKIAPKCNFCSFSSLCHWDVALTFLTWGVDFQCSV